MESLLGVTRVQACAWGHAMENQTSPSPPSAHSQVHKLKLMKWELSQFQLQEGMGTASIKAKGVSLVGENLPGQGKAGGGGELHPPMSAASTPSC